jgi:hypothetical protein
MAKDKTVTSFPTMGTEAAKLANVAKPIKGRSVPKTGNSKGGMIEAATASRRATVMERNGFQGAPQVKHSYPTAPEAAQTQRNTVIVPSALGNRDFYLRRQYGQNT